MHYEWKAWGFSKKFKGRYLNGEATIRFALPPGELEVYLVDLKGPTGALPEPAMQEFRKQNLMQDARTDPNFERMFEALEELKVEDGKLWIVPKKAADRPKTNP